MNQLSRKKRFSVLSDSEIRICDDNAHLLDNYASKSCSCSYGVVVDTLSENKFIELSSDILTIIKSSHSYLGNNTASVLEDESLMNSLQQPYASSALFKKLNQECAN